MGGTWKEREGREGEREETSRLRSLAPSWGPPSTEKRDGKDVCAQMALFTLGKMHKQ